MEISGQYLTYIEYKALGGTIAETPFKLLEFEARKIIDYYTFGRLMNLETQKQEVKLCVFNLINSISTDDDIKGKSSERVGNYSVTYENYDIEEYQSKYNSTIKTYLGDLYLDDGTPYLYIGLE